MIYYIKFVNGYELEINADGYNVYHHGKIMSFYTQNPKGYTNIVAEVMTDNVLFITREEDDDE